MNLIENYIPFGYNNRISRQMLSERTGMTDRINRNNIEDAVRDRKVLIISSDGGYFRPTDDKLDQSKMSEYFRKEESRAKSIFKKLQTIRSAINSDPNQMELEV